MYILIAILIFGVLIAVHELGHFLAAKLFGVRVNEFSIGMGPALFQRQKGDTLYSLRVLPIGGYCAMEGEEGDSEDPKALNRKKLLPRLIIFAAGALMNFAAGVVILLLLYSNLSFVYAPVITGFADGFPARGESALMEGDRILSIDGEPIYLYEDISIFLNMGDGESYDFVVRRNGEKLALHDVPLSPQAYENPDGTTSVRFGLNFGETVEATPLVKCRIACLNAVDFVRLTWYSLKMLVTGQVGLADMSGPIGIVTTISDVGSQASSLYMALANIGYLTALITINLAVMNLLPLPALDGGHIFISCITALITKITRRPVDPKYEGYLNYAGFMALMLLMLVITASDITKLFG